MRIFFCLLYLISFQTYAQQWLGIASSNYSGTYGIYYNPANVADTRYKFFQNVIGGNAELINNYAAWGAPYSFIGLSTNNVSDTYRTLEGKSIYKNIYTQEAIGKKNSVAYAGGDVRGPSMIYTFEKAKFAVGLTTRMRLLTNLNHTSSDIAHILINTTAVPDLYGKRRDDNHFTLNLNSYAEMGLSFGLVIREQDQNFIKVGITAKRVNSILNVHYLARDIDFTIDRVPNRPQRQNVLFHNAEGVFGLTNSDGINNAGFSPDWLFGKAAAGIGYGFDAGVVYEYRPEYSKYDIKLKDKWLTDGTQNKYLYRIGLALLDIGQIKFNNPAYVRQTTIAESDVLVAPGTFNKIDSPDKLYKQMNNAFELQEVDYNQTFVSSLPTAFSANFDYKYSDKIYLNAMWIQSLRNPNTVGMVQPSMFAITPRWESKWLEVAIPLALQNGYRNFTVGLTGRAGPLFIGTDNIGGILNIGNPRGISAYVGLFLPIFRKLPNSPNACYTEQKPTLREGIRNIFHKRKQQNRWKRIR